MAIRFLCFSRVNVRQDLSAPRFQKPAHEHSNNGTQQLRLAIPLMYNNTSLKSSLVFCCALASTAPDIETGCANSMPFYNLADTVTSGMLPDRQIRQVYSGDRYIQAYSDGVVLHHLCSSIRGPSPTFLSRKPSLFAIPLHSAFTVIMSSLPCD